MVPGAGLEPARHCWRGILSPLCLPIPPPGQFMVLELYYILCKNIDFFLGISKQIIIVIDLNHYFSAIAIKVSVASILLSAS